MQDLYRYLDMGRAVAAAMERLPGVPYTVVELAVTHTLGDVEGAVQLLVQQPGLTKALAMQTVGGTQRGRVRAGAGTPGRCLSPSELQC